MSDEKKTAILKSDFATLADGIMNAPLPKRRERRFVLSLTADELHAVERLIMAHSEGDNADLLCRVLEKIQEIE